MPLYQKYRPQSLSEIVGNNEMVASVESLLRSEDPPHSWMFTGQTGTGKTTIARIVAKELGCNGNDFREIDSADFRGIDTIREIRRQSSFKPLEGKNRGWLLDEVHQCSNEAQSALLKALEDTPGHVYYFLCTTHPHKVLDTIRSRCTEFQLKALDDLRMKKLLRSVVISEGESLEKRVYDQIIMDAQGRSREALQILEKVLSVESDQRLDMAMRAAEQQSKSIELCRALIDGSPWSKVRKILDGLSKEDPESVRRSVLGYCSSVLLNGQGDPDTVGCVLDALMYPVADASLGFPRLVAACQSALKR